MVRANIFPFKGNLTISLQIFSMIFLFSHLLQILAGQSSLSMTL
ncbi:DUF1145 domain-containing protein [Spirosoma sordidisoli]|uniref:DUF1145 domain-containing protein n=1 Tax=Spirosoma sordidisoli TaxID=2502893 RepID=A0A4Q2UC33_9BACT|nr:DUF1145 domain-containing protein [Spirosoma sordidisoli]